MNEGGRNVKVARGSPVAQHLRPKGEDRFPGGSRLRPTHGLAEGSSMHEPDRMPSAIRARSNWTIAAITVRLRRGQGRGISARIL